MDYDIEYDKLIHFLFPEGILDEYEDNPKFLNYINKLGTLNVEELYQESKSLENEKITLDNQAKNLALENYKTFLETVDCSRNIHKEICKIENNIESFKVETPNLKNECAQFVNTCNEIKEKRRRNNLILSHSDEILQILEIPQFMNICIRKELYEEALLLPTFVKKFSSKHGNIPLIANIAKDVEASWWELMKDLLRQLTSDISLPKCLEIIGFLRRMKIFSEVELRLKFLQARGTWLDSMLHSISNDDKKQHLSLVVDVTRENIFSIATQFKAIFTDDSNVVTRNTDLKNVLFYSWLNKRVNDFIATLESDLPMCVPNAFDLLLGQCMYFGQSFGRIGADFRGSVIQVFVTTVQNNFEMAIKKADEIFVDNMTKFSLPKINPMSLSKIINNETGSSTLNLSLPISLVDFHPLAEHCNSILSAFNDLRYCNLIGCLHKVTQILQDSLENVSSILFAYYQKENITWVDREKEIFNIMISYHIEQFIPFIQNCLTILFQPENIAKHYEVSISCLENEGLGFLNISKITNPLNTIL